MGQNEKARAVVAEKFEFTVLTRLTSEQWVAAATRVGAASKTTLNGSVGDPVVKTNAEGTTTAVFRVMGPGRVIEILRFVVAGKPNDAGMTQVSLTVGNFLFKKGSLGAKPTINASKFMTKFVGLLKAELSAG